MEMSAIQKVEKIQKLKERYSKEQIDQKIALISK